MRKTTQLRAQIEGHDGIAAERAKTHGRHIEQADVVGLLACLPTHIDFEIGRLNDRGADGMCQPLVTRLMHIHLRTKGTLVGLALGTRIDQ